jgi:hypothetical protein
MSRKR